jgi:hypothetical protein
MITLISSCAIFFFVYDFNKTPFSSIQVLRPGENQSALLKMVTRQAFKRKITNRGQSPVLNQDKIIEKKRPKN